MDNPTKLSIEEILAKKNFYENSFYDFTRDILGYDRLRRVPHWGICDFIANSPGDGTVKISNSQSVALDFKKPIKIPNPVKHKALLVPRGTFKSTIVCVAYPIWRLVKNPYHKTIITGFNVRLKEVQLNAIKNHLENNYLLRYLWGDMAKAAHDSTQTWAKQEITVYDPYRKKYAIHTEMKSILIGGIGTGITGTHPNTIIPDDLVTPENTQNQDGMDGPKNYIDYIEGNLTEEGAEVILSGTIYKYGDAHNEKLTATNWDIYHASAYNDNGTAWFPEKQSLEFLEGKRANMTEEAFASQFLLNPINPESAVFRKEWIDQSLISPCPIEREKFRILMTVDPSVSTSKRADYTGICVMGLDHTGRFWVFEAKKKKLRNEDLVAELQRIYKTWNPEAMVVEEVVFSELLKPLLTRSDKPLYEQIRYRGHKLDNKRSKAFRIKSTTPLLEFGCVNIFNNQTDLISELRRYTGKDSDSDDVLDAFQIAIEELRPPDYKVEIKPEQIMAERKANEDRDILTHLHPQADQFFANVFLGAGGQGGYR